MQMSAKLGSACLALLLVLTTAAGCGKKPPLTYEADRGGVSGVVTIDGKHLEGGSITFISAKDKMYRVTCMLKRDGTFRAGDAPLGDVLVAVETESTKMGGSGGYVPIPAKYAAIATSGLKATITKAGPDGQAQTLSFDLKSK